MKDYGHPGGNITGVSTHHRELLAKRFELLRDLLPKAKRVALLAPIPVVDPSFLASESTIKEVCARLNFELIVVSINDLREIEKSGAEAVIVYATLGQRLAMENVIQMAAKLRVATIFRTRKRWLVEVWRPTELIRWKMRDSVPSYWGACCKEPSRATRRFIRIHALSWR